MSKNIDLVVTEKPRCSECGTEPAYENGVCRWEDCEKAAREKRNIDLVVTETVDRTAAAVEMAREHVQALIDLLMDERAAGERPGLVWLVAARRTLSQAGTALESAGRVAGAAARK